MSSSESCHERPGLCVCVTWMQLAVVVPGWDGCAAHVMWRFRGGGGGVFRFSWWWALPGEQWRSNLKKKWDNDHCWKIIFKNVKKEIIIIEKLRQELQKSETKRFQEKCVLKYRMWGISVTTAILETAKNVETVKTSKTVQTLHKVFWN